MMQVRRLTSHSSLDIFDDDKSWDGTGTADIDIDTFDNSMSVDFLHQEYECEAACEHDYGNVISDNLDDLKRTCIAFEKGVTTHKKYYLRHRRGSVGRSGRVFTGHDAVSFLVNNGYAKNGSREEALLIGRKLAYEFALFHHETHDFDLEDAKNLYYVFIPRNKRVVVNRRASVDSQNTSHSLHAIADAFEEGVVTGSNVYKGRAFKDTFVGSNAVTFLVTSQIAKTRQDAVRIGQLLMDRGQFQHLSEKHKFKDKHLLYRYVPEKLRPKLVDTNKEAIPIEAIAQTFVEVVKPGDVFSGSQLVDTMLGAGLVLTRSDAVLLGEKLRSELQLFHCVQSNNRGCLFDRSDVYYKCDEVCKTSSVPMTWLTGSFVTAKVESAAAKEGGTRKLSRMTAQTAKSTSPDLIDGLALHKSDHSFLEDLVVLGASHENVTFGSSEFEDTCLETSGRFDKFGFIIEDDGDVSVASTSHFSDTFQMNERELSHEEWTALLENCALDSLDRAASLRALKQCMRGGLPDSLRRQAWTIITGVDAVLEEREGEYQTLVETATRFMEDEKECGDLRGVIERDLHRTFPRHQLFCNRASFGDIATGEPASGEEVPDGLVALRRILYAYSIYDNEVGYCQGMNFIAAMFLTFLSEEESFWLLVAVMNEEPYGMRRLFDEDMAGVQEVLYIAEKLIQKFLPNLYKHFDMQNINCSMFATQWIMTVFTSTFPFDLVARVWDSFLVEGRKVVYRVMLSLLEDAQCDLLGFDLEDTLTYLRDDIVVADGLAVMKASLKIPLRRKHMKKYANEWRLAQKNQKRSRISSVSIESGTSSYSGMMNRIGLNGIGVNGSKSIAVPGLSRNASM